ncbi:MAG: hypothetical protein JW810_00075, partial [Sedimentisphaerales bacterium]|nr:hypothetical protein [Sedimentisphaerales bacterium]
DMKQSLARMKHFGAGPKPADLPRSARRGAGLVLKIILSAAFLAAAVMTPAASAADADEYDTNRIKPWTANPRYWQYRGRPILLAGGSKDDNLFQIPDLRAHLDLLAGVGGNYIRNTMSGRNDKGFEVQAFSKRPDGLYDLNRFNPEYWQRFETLLKLTGERGIVVQIEVWDRFDHARENWAQTSPFNPKNNVNYTAAESGLKEVISTHAGQNENRLFHTVPALDNNQLVLKYQQAQVDKMLSISLQYDHVLYCMDNETSGSAEWGKYWSEYIRAQAKKRGRTVETTEMWDPWDLADAMHRHTFDHPETYSFVDISQNNHQKGQAHWDNAQKQRLRIAAKPRPLNCVKIYGADGGRFGDTRDGLERFWRNVFGGMASARFHRPDSGQGLNPAAQAHLKSLRLLTGRLDIFHSTPDADNSLLAERGPNEAYCTGIPGRQYAVYFPDGGSVRLDMTKAAGPWRLEWLDIANSRWQGARSVDGGSPVELVAPAGGHWAALLTPAAASAGN